MSEERMRLVGRLEAVAGQLVLRAIADPERQSRESVEALACLIDDLGAEAIRAGLDEARVVRVCGQALWGDLTDDPERTAWSAAELLYVAAHLRSVAEANEAGVPALLRGLSGLGATGGQDARAPGGAA